MKMLERIGNVGTVLDLSIDNSSNVSWLTGGGLSLDASTVITGSVATKVIAAVKGSNAISIEAWVNPANLTQEGPARIVSISGGTGERNMTLGQGLSGGTTPNLYNVRLRTDHWTISDNGSPALEGSVGSATTNLTHIVYTWDSSGTATLYINGVVDTTGSVPGGSGKLSNWDDGYPLMLGNETTGDRSWLGELHLVAIYSKALTAAEVSQNYNAGAAQPTPTPTATPAATDTPTPLPTATATPPPTSPPADPIVIQRVTYAIAGQPIAMRVSGDLVTANNGLHYLYSDHLGSNSAMQAPDGTITHTRYEPFGAYRGGSGGNAITDRSYTGHKQNDSLGLIYMNARFYVPGIARFASADTIVPDPANPQTFNRYSYVNNQPINLIDPTGHCGADATLAWDSNEQSYVDTNAQVTADCIAIRDNLQEDYGWVIEGEWSFSDVEKIQMAGNSIEAWIGKNNGGDAQKIMKATFGGTTFKHNDWIGENILNGNNNVRGSNVFLVDSFDTSIVVHELGHVLDNKLGFGFPIGSALFGGGPADDMARLLGADPAGCGWNRSRCQGYDTPKEDAPTNYALNGPSEDFADTFMKSVLSPIDLKPIRSQYMIDLAVSLSE